MDNYVEMVDFIDKLVQKFSTKSMFERLFLDEKLQNGWEMIQQHTEKADILCNRMRILC